MIFPVVGMVDTRTTGQYVEVPHVRQQRTKLHDPMVVELQARLPFGQEGMAENIADSRHTIMTSDAMRSRFWDRMELRQWIKTNCRGDVLMQAVIGGVWKLCCVDNEDHIPLFDFLQQRRKYTFVIEFANLEELAVIEQWVEDNVRGEKIARLSSPSSNQYHISIRDKEEAVMFRLRFSALAG